MTFTVTVTDERHQSDQNGLLFKNFLIGVNSTISFYIMPDYNSIFNRMCCHTCNFIFITPFSVLLMYLEYLMSCRMVNITNGLKTAVQYQLRTYQ